MPQNEIEMTIEQVLFAADIGYRQQRNAWEHGWTPLHRGGSLWGGSIESACAEYGASLLTGLTWTGGQVWKEPVKPRLPDLGERTELRWVDPKNYIALRFHKDRDDPERWYVLATGYAPRYEILGYLWGRDALKWDYWHRFKDGGESFQVPADKLEGRETPCRDWPTN